jgi:hypothetical protein
MKKLFGILVALILPFFINAQDQQNKIQGTWVATLEGVEMELVLNSDGTGTFDGDKIKYTAQNGKFSLTIIQQATTLSYSYILKESTLTVSGGDLDSPVTFKRIVKP